MAPEQATGRLREHGPATDVYALGVILFELLTGRPPHRGETDFETLRLVSDRDAPSPRSLRRGLPRDLETIVLKCLDKQLTRRYASAAELSAELQRFLDGRPVHARPIQAWEHVGKLVKRQPMRTALSIVIGLSMLAVAGALVWERQRMEKLRVAVNRSHQSAIEAREQRALAQYQGLLAQRHDVAN